ncbi:hypothetical protein GCM10027614_35920 [Micromonospora vulcania]
MPRPLTVVGYDTRELARVATERLFERIAGDDSPPATTVLPTRLLRRGCPPPDPAARSSTVDHASPAASPGVHVDAAMPSSGGPSWGGVDSEPYTSEA